MLASPPFLNRGDLVAITAPAGKLNRASIQTAIEILEGSWGLRVLVGSTVGASYHGFADTDLHRTLELQGFLNNPDVKLILAARGGYGCSKIIDLLDFEKFKGQPKWLCGFSDLTALLCHVQSLGFQAIHGPMAKTMALDEASNESLRKLLFGEAIHYSFTSSLPCRSGTTTAEAVGGNLCLLVHTIGTPSDLSYENKILFLEDVGEYLYDLDRMMVQLKRAKKLANLAGLVIGDFSDIKENDEPFGKAIHEIIVEHIQDYSFPYIFDFPFGHEKTNFAIPMGGLLHLEVEQGCAQINNEFYA
jgi:muramoyltetrapeptide carboxypeptidase